MSNTEIVQALKDNEKPFGLMMASLSNDPEYGDMMEVFKRVGKNFQRYGDFIPGDWSKGLYHLYRDHTSHGNTYRLRPDYKEEQEVVEIPVDPPSHSSPCLSFQKDDNIRPLYAGPEYPDFIGYRYQDDNVSGFVRMYRGKAGGASFNSVPFENLDRYEVLTPTHVLFKGKDNE